MLAAEGVDDGELGIAFVGPDEMRALKSEHLGIDEATDVLSFPLDGRDEVPDGVPRALGDVVLCPQVVGDGVARAARARTSAPARLRPRRRDGGPGGGARERSEPPARSQSLFQSFNFAAEGIIHAVRTQRNLSIHFAIAVAVLVAAIGFGATKLELAVLLLAITFVLVAELVNTAVEAAVDVASTSFDPMAKIAKDIAAGAVLVAALNAVAVGYLVFSGEVATRSSRFLTRLSDAPAELTLVALAVTVILVIAVKAYTGRGTPLRGGLPSGHAAVAFAGWMAVTLILEDSPRRFLISSVTFIMALLVAQTRVETGVHSASEVASGACSARSSRSSSSRRSDEHAVRPTTSCSLPPTRSRRARTRRTRTSTWAVRCSPATDA